MGAWGPGIFEDDTACEVRDEFVELVAGGLSAEQATGDLVRRWGTPDFDPDERAIFWLALAAAQVQSGRLTDLVRSKAINIIDAGGDIELYFDQPRVRDRRKLVLEKLKTQLLGPQRKAKPLKAATKHETNWGVGNVWAFTLSDGFVLLFRVTGHHRDKGGTFAWVEVLEGKYRNTPSELSIALTRGRLDRGGRVLRLFVRPEYERDNRLVRVVGRETAFAYVTRRVRQQFLPRLAGRYHYVSTVDDIEVFLSRELDLG